MKTKAFAARKPGLAVEPLTLEIAEPTSQEVSVRITHCSVGRGDVSFLRNDYQMPQLAYPLVAGHEMVGVIESLGAAVSAFAVGDRVGIGYQVSCCGECAYCKVGREQLCQKQACLVADRQGGFASHIVVHERFVFKIPDALQSAEAAPLFCAGLTGYSAIKKARVKEGDRVGVVGVGGLGHFAVQILSLFGAEVTAFSMKSQVSVKGLGAAEVVSYESPKVRAQTFDKLFITTHAHVAYDRYLELLKPDGELWVIGVDTQQTTFSSWLLNDYAQRSIRGSYIGSPAEMRELLELANEHGVVGKVKVLPAARLNEALRMVAEGSQEFRIVVEM